MKLFWQCLAAVLAGVACAGALVLVFPPKARGAGAGVQFDCAQLATAMIDFANFRDAGADRERVVRLALEKNSDASPAHQAAIAREIRRLWREGLPRDDAGFAVYKRCKAQFGDMGVDL